MEDYFQAKRRLFIGPAELAPARAGAAASLAAAPEVCVVNGADPYGARLVAELDGALTFAVEASADYRASELRCGLSGCRFKLHAPAAEREVALSMPGRFNVANALGALATAHALGADLDALL